MSVVVDEFACRVVCEPLRKGDKTPKEVVVTHLPGNYTFRVTVNLLSPEYMTADIPRSEDDFEQTKCIAISMETLKSRLAYHQAELTYMSLLRQLVALRVNNKEVSQAQLKKLVRLDAWIEVHKLNHSRLAAIALREVKKMTARKKAATSRTKRKVSKRPQ